MIINLLIPIKLLSIYYTNKLSNLILILLSFNKIKLNAIIILLMVLCIFYFSSLYIQFLMGLYFFIFKINYFYFLNLFLFGFFKIHTPLFYISSILYCISFFKNFIIFKIRYYICLMFSIASFVLGSLWALYLYSWGYYWSNDSIEYVLLFLIINYICLTHRLKEQVLINYINFLLIVYTIQLVRSNLIYTKHNFFQLVVFPQLIFKILKYLFFNIFFFFNFRAKFFTNSFNRGYFMYYLLIVTIIFNLLNIIEVKYFIYNVTYIVSIFLLLSVNWSLITYIISHIFIFFIFFIFLYFSIFYLLVFVIKSTYYTLNMDYNIFYKSFRFYQYRNSMSINWANVNFYNKLENFIKKETTNTYIIFKKLINFFS